MDKALHDKTDRKRILIVKLSSIGDVVSTTPVAKALRKAFPNAYIAWVVESKSKDVVVGNPYLDEVIVWKRDTVTGPGLGKAAGFLASLVKLGPALHARKFDIVIDLQGLLRSALVTWASGAPLKLGYDNARECAALFYNLRLPAPRHSVRGPQQYLNMLKLLEVHTDDLDMHVPIDERDRAFARDFLGDAYFRSGQRVAALCPATTWPQKHWTEKGWARLADALASDYGVLPVFMGSPADVPLIRRIRGSMKSEAAEAVGRTTLKQAAAILELSNLVVTVDTGLMHISLALKRPTVSIFGPTRWQHYPKKETFAVVAKEFSCMPCMRHPTCKQYDCMSTVTAEDVLAAAGRWLDQSAGP